MKICCFIYVIILSFQAITSLGPKNKASFLYWQMCHNLDNAYKYRNTKDWLKFEEYDHKNLKGDKFEDVEFSEWKNRYESIRRFFYYCDFLETCDKEQDFYEEFYESDEFRHIAIKPQFLYPNGDTMPISDAMRKIVEAYKIIFRTKIQKLNFFAKKRLPEMRFINKTKCTEVLAWVYVLKMGQNVQLAKANLFKIKMHLFKNELDVGLVTYPPPPKEMEKNKNAGQQHNTEELLDDMTKLWTYQMMIHSVDDNANENAKNGKDSNDANGSGCGGCWRNAKKKCRKCFN